MSRCFPFPPPGYEKKSVPDDADLLKKEHHKEKKHKKEKKRKEKREGKEKREKDKSDGKHKDKKDKKDKKEKHRDKKKDKDKDKAKDKDRDSGKPSSSGKKTVVETNIYNEDVVFQKERIWDSGKSVIIPDERKSAVVQFQSHNGGEGKPIQNSLVAREVEGFRFVEELNRRIGDEQKGSCQLVEKSTGTDRKNDTGIDKFDNRKMFGQETRNEARFSGIAMARDVGECVVDGTLRPLEENSEKRMAEEKKVKIEFEHKQREDKRKDNKDREKKVQAKDKDREKEKKKMEKVKCKSEHNYSVHDKFNDINNNDHNGTFIIDASFIPYVSDKNNAAAAVVDRVLKRRKDIEANGFLHDDDFRLNKMARPIWSHPSMENGRKLDHHQTPPPLVNSDNYTNNHKMDVKEIKLMNGSTETQPPPPVSLAPMKPPSAAIAKEPKKKSPHPDYKYLDQVLSVPKMENWSDFDDQDWLFSPPSKKNPNVVHAVEDSKPALVWAQAFMIDSADICALPYVIPY